MATRRTGRDCSRHSQLLRRPVYERSVVRSTRGRAFSRPDGKGGLNQGRVALDLGVVAPERAGLGVGYL